MQNLLVYELLTKIVLYMQDKLNMHSITFMMTIYMYVYSGWL